MNLACILSERIAEHAGRPLAQGGFLAFCALWLVLGGSVDGLTLLLSVLAISLTQAVLFQQGRITKAEHAKLDAIIAGTDADDAVAGIEKEAP
ncbi:MAG: hypothetical protein ACSLE1_01960 [Sphingobium sp.]